MIDAHVSAMVAVDDADESNGGLEVVSGCFDSVLPLDDRGCIEPSVARVSVMAIGPAAGRRHAVVPQPYASPQRGEPIEPAATRAVPHVQRGERG